MAKVKKAAAVNSAVVPVVGMSSRCLKDQELNRMALEALLSEHLPPGSPRGSSIRLVLDIRYGLGEYAKTVCRLYPRASYYGVECDRATYAQCWCPPSGDVVCVRFDPHAEYLSRWSESWDLLLGDFSNVTVKNRTDAVEACASIGPRYFLFADVGCMRLHLHWKTYGLTAPDLDEYWQRWTLPGYSLVGWQRAHPRCSLALYKRT